MRGIARVFSAYLIPVSLPSDFPSPRVTRRHRHSWRGDAEDWSEVSLKVRPPARLQCGGACGSWRCCWCRHLTSRACDYFANSVVRWFAAVRVKTSLVGKGSRRPPVCRRAQTCNVRYNERRLQTRPPGLSLSSHGTFDTPQRLPELHTSTFPPRQFHPTTPPTPSMSKAGHKPDCMLSIGAGARLSIASAICLQESVGDKEVILDKGGIAQGEPCSFLIKDRCHSYPIQEACRAQKSHDPMPRGTTCVFAVRVRT